MNEAVSAELKGLRRLAVIKPFKGMRYTKKAGDISALICPPYDIISMEERQRYLEQNPYNIIRLELPVGEDAYQNASDILSQWLSDDILKCDMDEGLYIYELDFLSAVDSGERKKLKGLICRVRIEDFASNIILPHEETLSKAKTDRLNLTKATNCNFSQIYSLYPDETHTTMDKLNHLCAGTAPRYELDDGAVVHRLWVVNDPVCIASICDDFIDRKLYIADGHHRYETSINYRNYCRAQDIYNPAANYVMMYLADMADDGLIVFPTHRIVRGLSNFDGHRLIEQIGAYFYVEAVPDDRISAALEEKRRLGEKAFVYYDLNQTCLLTLKSADSMLEVIPDQSSDYRMLDVSILHSLILEQLLKIDKENMASQKNLTYTRSIQEALAAVQTGSANCAFFLNPTAVSEIGAVAANGEKMPQKSTYFYPKLSTGLVMNNMNE